LILEIGNVPKVWVFFRFIVTEIRIDAYEDSISMVQLMCMIDKWLKFMFPLIRLRDLSDSLVPDSNIVVNKEFPISVAKTIIIYYMWLVANKIFARTVWRYQTGNYNPWYIYNCLHNCGLIYINLLIQIWSVGHNYNPFVVKGQVNSFWYLECCTSQKFCFWLS
jgi:hypothetical protein